MGHSAKYGLASTSVDFEQILNSAMRQASWIAGVQKRSFLLLLDAKNLQEVGRAWTQDPVPLGFHGHFSKPNEFLA